MKLTNPPTLRNKKRYIVIKIYSKKPLNFFSVKNAIWKSVLDLIGEINAGKSHLKIYKNLYSAKNQTCFVRCTPKFVDYVKTALSLIHQIGDQRVVFRSVHTSGTIKSGKKILSKFLKKSSVTETFL